MNSILSRLRPAFEDSDIHDASSLYLVVKEILEEADSMNFTVLIEDDTGEYEADVRVRKEKG